MEADLSQSAALIADLDDPDKPTIRAAVDKLIPRVSGSPELRELLQRRLAEPGHKNYWPVAYVLGHLPHPSGATLERLLEALDHREPDIRWAVALLLVKIAKANQEAAFVDSLMRLCTNGSEPQKRMALYVIRDLSRSDPASLAAMLAALSDRAASVRVAAAICLKARADLDLAAKNLLLELYLKDEEPKVRHAVAITLAHLGAPPAAFLTALQHNSRSADPQTRKAALAALDLLEKRRSASSGSASDR